jgi:hypothetical protein
MTKCRMYSLLIAFHSSVLLDSFVVCLISGFRHDVDEICFLLGYYTALSGSSLPMFRDNLSVSSSRVKKSKKKDFPEWCRFFVLFRKPSPQKFGTAS